MMHLTVELPKGSTILIFNGPNCEDIRECDSTLYVGLAHIAPPTNINF